MKNKLTKLFNNYYVNIVGKSSDTKPKTFGINFENTKVQSVRDIVNSSINQIIQALQKYYTKYYTSITQNSMSDTTL